MRSEATWQSSAAGVSLAPASRRRRPPPTRTCQNWSATDLTDAFFPGNDIPAREKTEEAAVNRSEASCLSLPAGDASSKSSASRLQCPIPPGGVAHTTPHQGRAPPASSTRAESCCRSSYRRLRDALRVRALENGRGSRTRWRPPSLSNPPLLLSSHELRPSQHRFCSLSSESSRRCLLDLPSRTTPRSTAAAMAALDAAAARASGDRRLRRLRKGAEARSCFGTRQGARGIDGRRNRDIARRRARQSSRADEGE
jgi:hypothetical protein